MGRPATKVPARVAWAVDLLDVQPDDHVLDIGVGPDVIANLKRHGFATDVRRHPDGAMIAILGRLDT